jgi:hypothetical protein
MDKIIKDRRFNGLGRTESFDLDDLLTTSLAAEGGEAAGCGSKGFYITDFTGSSWLFTILSLAKSWENMRQL